MSDEEIEKIALHTGFKLKAQLDGTLALNPYVFEFARALLAAAQTQPAQGYSISLTDCHYTPAPPLQAGIAQVLPLQKQPETTITAPTPPAQEAEPYAWTGKGCGVITNADKKRMIEQGKYGGEFASAARTAELHNIPIEAKPEKYKLMYLHAAKKLGSIYKALGIDDPENIEGVFAVIEELKAGKSMPAQEAEPVAWALQREDGKIAYWAHSKETVEEQHIGFPHLKIVGIFTRPDQSELVKAAEEVLEAFRDNSSRHPVQPVLLNAISNLNRVVIAEKDAQEGK